MSNEGATTQADLIETELEGTALLTNPMLNKGTAFTDEERTAFALHGLLPPHVGTLEVQSARRLQAVRKLASDLDRYVFLRGLQDANETLFYAVLTQNSKKCSLSSTRRRSAKDVRPLAIIGIIRVVCF